LPLSRGGTQVKGTKTGDIRRIAIGPKSVKLLKAHKKRADGRAKKCGATLKLSAYIFSPDPASQRPYNPYTITRTFAEACREAGVAPMRLHDRDTTRRRLCSRTAQASAKSWIDMAGEPSKWSTDTATSWRLRILLRRGRWRTRKDRELRASPCQVGFLLSSRSRGG
jgi:hypothetical protein